MSNDDANKPKLDDYIYRFNVKLKGARTSVSLDSELVKLVLKKLGSREALIAWVQSSTDAITLDFPGEKPNAGYSRILQQKAILLIADPLVVAKPLPSMS